MEQLKRTCCTVSETLKKFCSYKLNCFSACGLPRYESAGECVETCPDDQFGNGTTGACETCESFIFLCHSFY